MGDLGVYGVGAIVASGLALINPDGNIGTLIAGVALVVWSVIQENT